MKDLYKSNEYCMAFSNETIKKYFFDKAQNELGIKLSCSYCDVKKFPCDVVGNIDYISCDDFKEELAIRFFRPSLTAIFILDEIFMFYDYTDEVNARETVGSIIYEGYLRDKTHKQILDIFLELFKILYGATKIEYEEHLVSKIGYYNQNNYTVKLKKPNCEKQAIQFENILFLIN